MMGSLSIQQKVNLRYFESYASVNNLKVYLRHKEQQLLISEKLGGHGNTSMSGGLVSDRSC